jgi:hypothetical protein
MFDHEKNNKNCSLTNAIVKKRIFLVAPIPIFNTIMLLNIISQSFKHNKKHMRNL